MSRPEALRVLAFLRRAKAAVLVDGCTKEAREHARELQKEAEEIDKQINRAPEVQS